MAMLEVVTGLDPSAADPTVPGGIVKDAGCGLRGVSGFFGRIVGPNLVTNRYFSGFLVRFLPERAKETVEMPDGTQMSAQRKTKNTRDGP